ncbi:MAG TPA: isopentenyl-diphosphate Delta-isomerase [Bacteroidia bacterium]|nr:isopentenyl-diphosphate Delta-isomerase [Bacteroidia bacterium]
MTEHVILVDESDKPLGSMEKMDAHRKGVLHRAFSVFIFNSQGLMLLQQRAIGKYHSGGLWTNTCCSHPRPGESTMAAAQRRLKEEMGMEVELNFKTSFTYKATFSNTLTEHEFDHVFTGTSDSDPRINKDEVENFQWLPVADVKKQIASEPDRFTAWFMIAMEKLF